MFSSKISALCNCFIKSGRIFPEKNGALVKVILNERRYHKETLFVTPQDAEENDKINRHAHPKLTTLDLVSIFANELGHVGEYSPSGVADVLQERKNLMDFLPKSVDELPPRRMKDSFVTAVIPLKDRLDIRERYVTFDGNVRIGRVLEDMDIFSVYCAFRHILNPRSAGKKNPYSVVTALVDSLHVSNQRMINNEDVRLAGHVTYAGRSSIEVSLVVDQMQEGVYTKIFDAVFLMVARDPMNTGGALINPLVADSDAETQFLHQGIERQAIRKAQELDSLARKPPTEEERHLIHDMFIKEIQSSPYADLPVVPGVRMDDTALKTVFICHPQYRNRYNKIFGGFIMRQACELAFTNTFIYVKQRPRLINIDDIVFRRPVEIGSILRYTSHVGYVEKNFIHCPVRAEVINPVTGECQLTNVFQFTFKVDDDGTANVPPLTFDTYKEAMVYLESRRHFKKMMNQYFPSSSN